MAVPIETASSFVFEQVENRDEALAHWMNGLQQALRATTWLVMAMTVMMDETET